MDIAFFLFGTLLCFAVMGAACVYSLVFEWLPDYLRGRTSEERATEWVNSHPIKKRVRRTR